MTINSVRTVSFIGDYEELFQNLTRPSDKLCFDNSFLYKSSLYRIENFEDSTARVVVFSATDLLYNFEELLILSNISKTIVFLTDCKKLKRIGIKLNRKALCYILPCPVIFDSRYGSRGVNKLLSTLHIVSSTPEYSVAMDNIKRAKKSIFSFKHRFTQKIYNKIIKFGKNI